MLPATNHDDTHSSDAPAPPAAPLGFSGVPASTPLPSLQPIESITPPVHGTEPPTPVADEPEAPARPLPAAPVAREDWVPLADDFLPAAPRSTGALSSLGVGTPKQGLFARLRRQRDDVPPAVEPAPGAPVEPTDVTTAPKRRPVAPTTPDDRESYAFWSQDRAPRDFSDVMALPDLPLDGSSDD